MRCQTMGTYVYCSISVLSGTRRADGRLPVDGEPVHHGFEPSWLLPPQLHLQRVLVPEGRAHAAQISRGPRQRVQGFRVRSRHGEVRLHVGGIG